MAVNNGKQVKLTIDFKVIDTDGQSTVASKVVKDFDYCGTEAVQHFPQKIAASQVDVPISFGGVTQGKRVILISDQPITVKINQDTDTGFPLGAGPMVIAGDPGITAIFITTGANITNIDAIIVGE